MNIVSALFRLRDPDVLSTVMKKIERFQTNRFYRRLFGMPELLVLLMLVFFASMGTFSPSAALGQEATNAYTVAVLQNWPPHYITDPETNAPGGFAVEVFEAIAARAGIETTYKVYPSWPVMFRDIRKGGLDIIPNSGITQERQSVLDFTTPVEAFQIRIFVRSTNNSIQTRGDLNDYRVGVVKSNKGLFLMQAQGVQDLQVYDSLKAAFWGLLAAEVDALVYPEPNVMKLAYDSKLADQIKPVGQPLMEIKRGIAVRKGQPELHARLNEAAQQFVKSEEYQRIYRKWYGAPEPFWNAGRVLFVMSVVLAGVILLMILFHYRSLFRLNRELKAQIVVREAAEEALQAARENLERQVAQRTQELKTANENLTAEIAERQKAEAHIRHSLEEKETLLQEIHHRVKNNMQVISSLLRLQASSIDDRETKGLFLASQNRVQAMSAVHETLYTSDSLSKISLDLYITKLSEILAQTMSVDQAQVTVNVKADPVQVSIEQATPLGLVLNELMSNAFKYAFPGGRKGEIRISVRDLQPGFRLVMEDDGIGLPEDFDWKNASTLGLQLVKNLIENQLRGTIQMEQEQRTRFIITINAAPEASN